MFHLPYLKSSFGATSGSLDDMIPVIRCDSLITADYSVVLSNFFHPLRNTHKPGQLLQSLHTDSRVWIFHYCL